MPHVPRILILSADPVAAALVGMLCEVVAFRAAFPAEDEAPIEAMHRVRPLYAVLIDDALDVASSELFRATAAKSGVRVLVFRPEARPPSNAGGGDADLILPLSILRFAEVLGIDAPGSVRRMGERRSLSMVPPHEDDTAPRGVVMDPSGCRWNVYDRRGTDRREGRDAPGTARATIERLFVNDAGEVRRYRIAADDAVADAGAVSARELAEQLARAQVVLGSAD